MISVKQKDIILKSLNSYQPTLVGIFGSYARNENKNGSDIDILVDFKNTVNLMELIGLELSLSEQLGIKVDLITRKSLSPRLEKYIIKDLLRII